MKTVKQVVLAIVAGLTLSACAQTPSSTAGSHSGVQVYGEMDVGVGTQEIRN
ncbi:hypothetical protein L1889_04660 [Paenalcaligenes niemegkensis]|uniref:hypothetical protein n=1 Tax=Paenalcaligenes niemegkensis TaxID=2895469 RepID=UPI001EE8945B|nr:hypothetical protein [Paenalcaligenes niemegkensis]MCQ9616082.1 hypothetical protein [Paenalcaligenes niemegkensis]